MVYLKFINTNGMTSSRILKRLVSGSGYSKKNLLVVCKVGLQTIFLKLLSSGFSLSLRFIALKQAKERKRRGGRRDEEKEGVIYKVNCKDCNKIYIGETKFTIEKKNKTT